MKNFLIDSLDKIDDREIEFGETLKNNNVEKLEKIINEDKFFKEKVEIFVSDKYLSESLIGKEKTKKLKQIVFEEDFGNDKLEEYKEFIYFINESSVKTIVNAMKTNILFEKNIKKLLKHSKKASKIVDEKKLSLLSEFLSEEKEENKKIKTRKDFIKFINESSIVNIIEAMKKNVVIRRKVKSLLENQVVSKKFVNENKLISLSSQLANEILFSDDNNEEKLNVTLGLNDKNSKADFPYLLKELPVNKTIKLLKEDEEFKNKVVKFFDHNNADKILGEDKSLLIKSEIGKEIGIKDLWEGDYRRFAENTMLMEKYFPEKLEEARGYRQIPKARAKKIIKIVRSFPKDSIEDIINKIPKNWINYAEDLESRADEIIQDEKKKMRDEGLSVNLSYDRPMKVYEEEEINEARTIGKVKKRKLKAMVKKYLENHDSLQPQKFVEDYVPEEWLDTWEGAYNEIIRLITDSILSEKYIDEEEIFNNPEDLLLEEYYEKTGDLDPLSVFGVKKK